MEIIATGRIDVVLPEPDVHRLPVIWNVNPCSQADYQRPSIWMKRSFRLTAVIGRWKNVAI